MIQAKKAVRKQLKLKIALIGPSGSGKTFSALRLAKGFGGKTLLCNTEGDRGYIYADEFDYDIVDLAPPFTPESYMEVIEYAEQNGYDTLIIDSGSHEWSGRGGMLEAHDKIPGNSYTNWSKITPRHNQFVDKQLYSSVHIINCLRGKDQYVLEENEKGKQAPKKVGVGAEQRQNYEYEMMVTLMLDNQTHTASAMKDNTHIFEGRFEVVTEEDGRKLIEWAESGESPFHVSTEQLAKIYAIASENDLSQEDITDAVLHTFKLENIKKLGRKQAEAVITRMPELWAKYVEDKSKESEGK